MSQHNLGWSGPRTAGAARARASRCSRARRERRWQSRDRATGTPRCVSASDMVLRILLAVACLTAVAHASPVDDLASPSQATRDVAAARLRATYKPLPGDAWIRKLGAIAPGTTKQS